MLVLVLMECLAAKGKPSGQKKNQVLAPDCLSDSKGKKDKRL